MTSVITAIVTVLLATVFFVLVQIAVFKCHPKFTPRGAETGTSARETRLEYEQMDERGVAVSDPVYTEVEVQQETSIALEENEAYAKN